MAQGRHRGQGDREKAWSIPPGAGGYIHLLYRFGTRLKIGLGGVSLCILVATRDPDAAMSDFDIEQATGLCGARLKKAKALAVEHGWLHIQQVSKWYACYSTRDGVCRQATAPATKATNLLADVTPEKLAALPEQVKATIRAKLESMLDTLEGKAGA